MAFYIWGLKMEQMSPVQKGCLVESETLDITSHSSDSLMKTCSLHLHLFEEWGEGIYYIFSGTRQQQQNSEFQVRPLILVEDQS